MRDKKLSVSITLIKKETVPVVNKADYASFMRQAQPSSVGAKWIAALSQTIPVAYRPSQGYL